MSLAGKWEEYKDSMPFEADEETWLDYQRAFYAGAEAQHMIECKVCDFSTSTRCLNHNAWLEIDHFRSHK